MKRKERFKHIINHFAMHQPIAETELDYNNPYELLVAVILSAQCTDKRVNMITPGFFKVFPDASSLAQGSVDEIFQLIRSCSYPNNKSKNLLGMAKVLTTEFNNIIPSDIKDLQKMPGVGRKTANVIASVVYNQPAMAVDTHVFRVSKRLGLTWGAKTALETERQLVQHIPEDKIPIAHHWIILHGRYVCLARKPKCNECQLTSWCRHYERQLKKELQTNDNQD